MEVLVAASLCAALFAVHVAAFDLLCDDSFISFRYARNLVAGDGLTWNPGERVEGYTNFAWVLMMAAALRAGLPVEAVARVLGVVSGLFVLAAVALLASRRRPPWRWTVWIAPTALAAHGSFAAWSTSGMETTFFTALVVGAVLAYLRESGERSERPWLSALLLAAAGLTRPEGALFIAALGACHLVEVAGRRRTVRSLLFWGACCVAPLAVHLLWRHHYYGFWLPNTFHAKVEGWAFGRGLSYLLLFHRTYQIGWFLPLALLAVAVRRRRDLLVASALAAPYLIYVAAIGGDRLELRFLVPVLPLLYWLVAEGIAWLAEGPLARPAGRRLGLVAAGLVAATLVGVTAWGGRRRVPQEERGGTASLSVIRNYARNRVEDGRYLRGLIERGELPDDLTVCVGGAGAVPYYTRWPTVDRRGLNDVRIARLPARPRAAPGHLREIPYGYLEERDVVVFDVFNDLVQTAPWKDLATRHRFEGRRLRIRAIRLDEERYLVFASLVSDRRLAEIFPGREILTRPPRRDILSP